MECSGRGGAGKTCMERRSGQGHVKVISALRDLLEADEEAAVARRFVGVEMELETLGARLELHDPYGRSEGVTWTLSRLFSVSGRKQKRYKEVEGFSLFAFVVCYRENDRGIRCVSKETKEIHTRVLSRLFSVSRRKQKRYLM